MIKNKLKAKIFLLSTITLSLAGCHNGAPTKEEVTKIYNNNLHTEDGKKAQLTDLRCTKHENQKFICFVGYKIVDKNGDAIKNLPTQGRENVQFFRLDNQWVAKGA